MKKEKNLTGIFFKQKTVLFTFKHYIVKREILKEFHDYNIIKNTHTTKINLTQNNMYRHKQKI